MLRYAIERLPDEQRRKYLDAKRKKARGMELEA